MRCSVPGSAAWHWSGSWLPAPHDTKKSPMQVVVLDTETDPMVWPSRTSYPVCPNHSISLLDCQGGVLDLRSLNSTRTQQQGTTAFYDCLIIYPDTE